MSRGTARSLPTGLAAIPTAGADPAVTVVGDTLLDLDWTGRVDRVCPDAPVPVLDVDGEARRPGGAGLAALCAAAGGAGVTLVTALGRDPEGASLRAGLERAGVAVVDLGLDGRTPTKLRLRAGGQSLVRADRNCSPTAAVGAWTRAATAAVGQAAAVLVSDYGRGLAADPVLSVLLQQRSTAGPAGAGAAGPAGAAAGPVVWDPHTRGPRPPTGLDLLTPNLAEAAALLGGVPESVEAVEAAVALARRFEAAVAVTAGAAGAVLAEPGAEPVLVPVEPAVGDVCGAGDRFAATVAVERARGASRLEAVVAAVAAARHHVLGGPPAAPGGAGGRRPRVVATGGCFDVLHAGHVRLLEAARGLGDELVVCLNGDLSVRRLKGPHRPINRVGDRAAVLRSLGCVDDVVVFEEDTPCEALRRIRPAVFVKGDDYAGRPLPEGDVLAGWGGRVVLLPVVPGRSTSRILHAAAASAAG
jgi:rfaE bifunctional protein nucleotidyltransferase chain/domain/rfaE bifunctional protein kinase chain/domain